MRYLIFIALVFILGCSVSKSNVEKKDLEIKTKSDLTIAKSDSSSTTANTKKNDLVVDNSVTVKEETKEETKTDSTGVKTTTTTTTKTTTHNNIVAGSNESTDKSTIDVEKEKEVSKEELELTDNNKTKSSFDSSSYGIYGIVAGIVILALLALKYYKKFLSLFL